MAKRITIKTDSISKSLRIARLISRGRKVAVNGDVVEVTR